MFIIFQKQASLSCACCDGTVHNIHVASARLTQVRSFHFRSDGFKGLITVQHMLYNYTLFYCSVSDASWTCDYCEREFVFNYTPG